MSASSVFNFYRPDYQPPGVFTTNNRYAPEFQILSEATIYSAANTHPQYFDGNFANPNSPPGDRPLIDMSPLINNINNTTMVIDLINERILYGTMSPGMRTTLTTMLGHAGITSDTPFNRAVSALYVTMLSPEFNTQR